MSPNLLSGLASEGIRHLAQNLFSAFYERGLSANQALRELRNEGLGYRRSDFLSDYAAGKGTYEQETRVKFVNENNIPSEGILSSQYHGVPDKYSFVFQSIGIDQESGEERIQYFYMHRNTLDKRSAMENDALEWISTQSEAYNFDPHSVSIKEGYINPIWK